MKKIVSILGLTVFCTFLPALSFATEADGIHDETTLAKDEARVKANLQALDAQNARKESGFNP